MVKFALSEFQADLAKVRWEGLWCKTSGAEEGERCLD